MSIIGDWHIDYVETNTQTTISFYTNGYFFQHQGRYVGRWFQDAVNNQKLTLKFDTLTLPNEPGPITLEVDIANDFKSFSGVKPNKAYAGGHLHYNARFLTPNPTLMPADGRAVEVALINGSMVTPTSAASSVASSVASVTSAVSAVSSGASLGTTKAVTKAQPSDDYDSPCQVRRTKR